MKQETSRPRVRAGQFLELLEHGVSADALRAKLAAKKLAKLQ